MFIRGEIFNEIYTDLIYRLFNDGVVSTSRKGKKLTELHNFGFVLERPKECMAVCRDMSVDYLKKEFDFYMSGSYKLEDAVKCSPFWKNCTDDGHNINSNYGALIFHDTNSEGNTQFEHAANCLVNNRQSKKAVMTLYNNEHSYLSNDNPCTMYLHARICEEHKLHLTAHMRSSDIYYGLPYDVPFFVFVQQALINHLSAFYPSLTIGTYTHFANSLHFYEYKRGELEEALRHKATVEDYDNLQQHYKILTMKHMAKLNKLIMPNFMEVAWKASEKSNCYKKKVGCCFTYKTHDDYEVVLTIGYGDIAVHRDRTLCDSIYEHTTCRRDDIDDKWYETGCPSVHAEHRALDNLRRRRQKIDYSRVTVYVTHGPCDACLKMLDFVGIQEVIYDIPYKTDYSHWPNMVIEQTANPSNREEGKSA